MLSAENAGVRVGHRWLLRDLSLALHAGEILAIVGPNGAGKSTLLSALAGDTILSTGRVLLDGRPISQYRPLELAHRRAVLPQQSIVQFSFTSREIVEMGRSAHDKDRIDRGVVDRVMTETDALRLEHRIFPTLSVGEQARVSLSRVLAQEAPVLLLDEPTAALDLRHQQLVMELARNLASRGAAIVMILHDLNLAASHADRVLLMREGVTMATGTPEATLTSEVLAAVFDCHVTVMPHPETGVPLILPLTGRTTTVLS